MNELGTPRRWDGQASVSTFAKTVGASLIVLFLGGMGTFVIELNGKMDSLLTTTADQSVMLAIQKADLDRLNLFMIEGKRFTLERGTAIEKAMAKLDYESRQLERRVTENTLTLATMPQSLRYPFDSGWQRRISDLENREAINQQRIEALLEKIKLEK